MAASFRATMPPHKAEEQIAILRLLTDDPAERRVRASAVDDGTTKARRIGRSSDRLRTLNRSAIRMKMGTTRLRIWFRIHDRAN